jgi:hopanoid biosynthesis associated protein HpnK
MVGAPAAADAVARAQRLPNLRVGLHIVLVDGDPASKRADVPGLLDGSGHLRNDLAGLGVQLMISRSLQRQMEKEIAAQFELFRAYGLPLDHVNAHRHFHLHPRVAAATIEIGRSYGMRALRVPVEPWRIVASIDSRSARRVGVIAAPWARWLRRQTRHAGLAIPDAVFGLAWSGAMTSRRLAALLARLPEGFVEIYLHPALSNRFAGAAPGYRYAEEFAALNDASCRAALQQSGFVLGGYADALEK